MPVKRILVGLGDEPFAVAATEHAVELAKRFEAEVTGITVVDSAWMRGVGPVPLGAAGAARELREYRMSRVNEVAENVESMFTRICEKAGLPHELSRAQNGGLESLIKQARYHDLIVLGLQSLLGHGVVSEPPAELVKIVESGVRPLVAVAKEYRPIHRVLIAYSGSMESAKTMKRFTQLQLWPQAVVTVATFNQDDEEAHDLLENARRYLGAHGISAQYEHIVKSPTQELLHYAETGAFDLLVVGNSAKRLLQRRIFGETALQVMTRSDRPIFLCQ